jgi:hypothetical protein
VEAGNIPGNRVRRIGDPSAITKLDPRAALIKGRLAAEPQLTAIAIVGHLAELHPDQFAKKQHSIVQRLLRALRKSAAHTRSRAW